VMDFMKTAARFSFSCSLADMIENVQQRGYKSARIK
jgi:hypothetical protein